MKRASLRLGVLVAALSLVVSSCSGGSSSDSRGGGSGTPKSGGTLTEIFGTDPNNLDPSTAPLTADNFARVATPLYDALVYVDPSGKIIPRLAESVTSTDNSTWSVKLRSGLAFSDGEKFDAQALKLNFDRYSKPTATRTVDLRGATTNVLDATTVEVHLPKPNAYFPRALMAQSGMIAAPQTIDQWNAGKRPIPIAAGPFKLSDYQPNTRYTYVRNTTYWNAPRPYLDKLIINIIPQPTQGYNTFRSGQADIVGYSPGLPKVTDELKQAGYQRLNPSFLGGQVFYFNLKKAPTNDVRVRQAIALSINLDEINEQVAEGHDQMADTLFPKDSPFYNPDLKEPLNNLGQAQQLIDSYVAEHGGPVTIELPASGSTQPYAQAIAQQIQRLNNVKVVLDLVDLPHIEALISAGTFSMLYTIYYGVDPADNLYQQLRCGAGRNTIGYCNPKVDQALETGQTTDDLTKRKAAYHTLEEELWKDMPFVLISRVLLQNVAQKYVQGFQTYGGGDIDMSGVWLDK